MPPSADPAGLTAREAGPFRADLRMHRNVAVINVAGVLDTVTAPTLASRLDAAIAAHPRMIVVDLLDAVFEGTAALYVLTEAHRLTQRGAVPMRIVANDAATTTQPLALISTIIEIYPTLGAATRQ